MKKSVIAKSSKGIMSKEYIQDFNETTELLYVCRYIKHQKDNHLDEITIKLMNDYQTLQGSKEAKKIEKTFHLKPIKVAKLLFNWFDTKDQDMLGNAFKLSRIDSNIGDYNFAAKNYLLLASKVLLNDPEKSKSLFDDELESIKESSKHKRGSYFFIANKIEHIKKINDPKNINNESQKTLKVLDEIDPSFSFKAEDLVILNNDLIKTDNSNSIYLFLIDRLYENHFSLEDTNIIWGHYIKNLKDKAEVENEFLRVARHYLQTMIFYKVVSSHNELKKKFHEYNGSKENKLKSVLNFSNYYFKDWGETLERAKNIQNFIQTHFYHGNNSTKEYINLCNSIEVLDENIKIFSVWPLMMYFSYQFKNENTSKISNFLNTEFSIDGRELIRMFNETESAWIPLTADNKPISTLKTIYSLSYLFSMGLLNNSGNEQDQSADFFISFVKKLTITMRNDLSEHISKFNKLVTRPEMNKYLNACDAFINMDKNREPIKVELSLTDLDKTLFIGTENAGIGSAFLKFYQSSQNTQDFLVSNQLIKFLKEINSLHNFINHVIKITNQIYETTLEQKVIAGLISKQEQQERLKKINSTVNELTNNTTKLRREFEKGVFKLYSDLDRCMVDFLSLENSLRHHVLDKIKPYFKNIYKLLNNTSPDENNIIPINGPEGYRGFDSMISNNSYNMHKIDIMIKIGEILKNTSSIKYNGKDILIAPSITPPSNFYNLEIIKRPKSSDIKPINNEDNYHEFENQIFLTMLTWSSANGEKFINWFGETYDLDKIIQKIELSRELLKASYYHSYNGIKSISPNSIIQALIRVSDYLNISNKDMTLLQLFNQESKHNIDQIRQLFYKNNTLIPYTENYFLTLKDELIPKTYLGIGQGTIMETIHFYKSQRDLDKFFFNIDKTVSEGIKEAYQDTANIKMKTIKDFMRACEKYQDTVIVSSHYLDSDFKNFDSQERIYNPEVFEDNINSIRKTFYEETGCFYNKTSTDINNYFKINIDTCEKL